MSISHNHRPYEYPDYVSPLPSEEMIKIGSMKQDMYSQGLQAAQGYMDNMAKLGIDLVKDTDKEYFTNEMEKLTESINGQARGVDFSNMSQVRSLMNVGKPLETDKNLINALKGTKEFRRRQEEMISTDSKFRSASNDWSYMKDASEWLNDGKVGTDLSFKQYTPYVDINDKLSQTLSKIKPDVYSRIINDGNGHITIEDIESLGDIKVQNAILASLDGKERGQLMIDASYDLHNMGPQAAQTLAINGTSSRLKATDKAIIGINQEIGDLQATMDSMKDVNAKMQIKREIDDRRAMLRNQMVAKQRYQEEIDSYSDVNTMDISKYYPYYFREYLTNQTSAWAYQQSHKKVQTDETYMEAVKFNHQWSLDRAKARDAMSLESVKSQNAIKQSKPIRGGLITHALSTSGGKVGSVLGHMNTTIDNLGALSLAAKEHYGDDSGAAKNLENLRKELIKASTMSGKAQLHYIAAVLKNNISDVKGSAYNKDIWDAIGYQFLGRTGMSVEYIKANIQSAIVNPVSKAADFMYNNKAKRVAINNSLNYDENVLNDMNFMYDPSLFQQDYLYFGDPSVHRSNTDNGLSMTGLSDELLMID